VFDNPTGRPLARVQVTLQQLTAQSAQASQPRSVLSNPYGQFEFSKLDAGVYLLNASKRTYLTGRYGQRAWNLPGTPIVIGDEALFIAEMRLKRLGVITGEIWDENHLGIPGVRVFAYKAGKTLQPAASGESDDRGVYRIYGLTPGKYYVRTGPKELEGEHGLLPTFFGQTVRREGALVANVRLEEETALVTVEPLLGRLSTIQIATQAIPNVMVNISLQTEFGVKTARVPAGTPAVFNEMPPGHYEATADAVQRDGPVSGYVRFLVSDRAEYINVNLGQLPMVYAACAT
jgi:hypothetical protein